ncbi:MAG: alpha/beta fold hydrolase [Elusimicrobiota bacterium]
MRLFAATIFPALAAIAGGGGDAAAFSAPPSAAEASSPSGADAISPERASELKSRLRIPREASAADVVEAYLKNRTLFDGARRPDGAAPGPGGGVWAGASSGDAAEAEGPDAAPEEGPAPPPILAGVPVLPRPYAMRTFRAADGQELRYDYRPPRPGAPIIVYLHGVGNRLQEGRGLDERVPEPYGVAFLERRGHGAEHANPAVGDLIRDNVDDLHALLAHLDRLPETGSSPLVVVGHSMGSDIVLRYLEVYGAKDPNFRRVKEIIILNPPGPDPLRSANALPRAAIRAGLAVHEGLDGLARRGGVFRKASAGLKTALYSTVRNGVRVFAPDTYRNVFEGVSRRHIDLLVDESVAGLRFDIGPIDMADLDGIRVQIYSGAKDGTSPPAMAAGAAALFGLGPEDRRLLAESLAASPRPVEWWDDPEGGHLTYLLSPEKFLRRLP